MQEAENAARQKVLEEKCRQIERLETFKKMNAAKAQLQVYEQEVGTDEGLSELLHDRKLMQDKPAPDSECFPVHHLPSPHYATHVQPATYAHREDSTTALAEAIAESINASCLPVPEPSVFTGDPLRCKDWKMSFQTLIGRKNIPVNEKVYYLRKYVGGPVKKATESYFLLGTDTAYH